MNNLIAINRPTEENPEGTEAWLVVSFRDPDRITYWSGYYFTGDVEQAVQFKRQKDGQLLIDQQYSKHKAYYSMKFTWKT